MYGHHDLDVFGYVWIFLSHLVKSYHLFHIKDFCGLKNTCIECYWMYLSCFKYIRNVYDSVKFLNDVMSFVSALGSSGSLRPV